MAANLSKRFALLCCCLMTMQALRLVISTAGFCVVRFHIDCELFNIFISRLVNAVMMSQLFGNWLGDLFVFALNGHGKLIATMLANWAEFCCFCCALYCLVHTEAGHLTGFYWSMVLAYFWWKVGEAPCTSIAAPNATDYYFAGFTLSGVWAACLKGLVMRCVTDGAKPLHFHSVPLGDVNVKVVGARSVKLTIDYRAAKLLYILTIILTFLMCLAWTVPVAVEGKTEQVATEAKAILDKVKNDKLKDAINKVDTNATVTGVTKVEKTGGNDGVDITVQLGSSASLTTANWKDKGDALAGALMEQGVAQMLVQGMLKAKGSSADNSEKTITIKVNPAGVLTENAANAAEYLSGVAFGGVLAVPGAMLGAGVGWVFALCFKWCLPTAKYASLTKWCQLIFGIVGAVGGFAAGVTPVVTDDKKVENEVVEGMWVEPLKWPWPTYTPGDKGATVLAAMIGLVLGLWVGFMVGLIVACCKPRLGGSAMAAGAFFGSFVGLISGEMANGRETWKKNAADARVVVCGIFIVVLGLGTVYSIYPGMAPCSITQFKYFNIIDILILILSSSGPLVTMGLDLAESPKRLGETIGKAFKSDASGIAWMTFGVLLLISTNICEILVLSIMQHPFSKMAKQVTNSGWRAVFLTVAMVTSQLVSSGIGFGCVAAGSLFNDGWVNVNSTAVLWTVECCGVLGEGYLTELKKYEPGKWPTQGMGKWDTYKWWNGKAFGNAWKIWCCIGTTDLRRDIMLCRQ